MPRYKVVLFVEVSEETKGHEDKRDVDDQTYIEEEILWSRDSFDDVGIESVELVED